LLAVADKIIEFSTRSSTKRCNLRRAVRWIVDGELAYVAAARNLPKTCGFLTRQALPHAEAFGRGIEDKPRHTLRKNQTPPGAT
jgi:hypothetical protein